MKLLKLFPIQLFICYIVYHILFLGWFDALITSDDNCSATIDDLEARVPGLSEGKYYQFRWVSFN